MKVLHFKTTYLNPSETFIDRLVRNQQTFEPIVATCYADRFVNDMKIYEMPKQGLIGLMNSIQLKLNTAPSFLFDTVKIEHPDIIHGHFGLDSYRLISLRNRSGIPLVVNFYGHDVQRLPKEFGWKHRYKRLQRNMDWAIAGSEDMKHNLADLGFDPSSISVIKLAVDKANIPFKLREKAGPKLMMVGRCVEKKGFIYALKALTCLKKSLPGISLDLYGDGALLPNLKSYARDNDLMDHITFHGFTPNKEIFEALYTHDILLVPSVQATDGDREGIPQTAVEGLSTGIPVIATDHAGLPEIVKDHQTGIQVPERNPESICRAVMELLNNDSLVRKISKNGREMVEQEHDIKKQVKKIEDLYTSLL